MAVEEPLDFPFELLRLRVASSFEDETLLFCEREGKISISSPSCSPVGSVWNACNIFRFRSSDYWRWDAAAGRSPSAGSYGLVTFYSPEPGVGVRTREEEFPFVPFGCCFFRSSSV